MFIESIVTSALTSGVFVWLIKSWLSERIKQSIQHEYDQALEVHKAKLRSDSDIILERLRADLQIASSKRNIEYNRIHEKWLEFISELTGKIILFHQSALKYVSIAEWSDGGTKEERRKIFAETLTAFDDYYFPRRLFIPSHTVGKIDAFRKGLLDISFDFMVRVEKGRDDGGNSDKQLDVWVKANEYITKENPKIIMDLENEFRKLLGMDEK